MFALQEILNHAVIVELKLAMDQEVGALALDKVFVVLDHHKHNHAEIVELKQDFAVHHVVGILMALAQAKAHAVQVQLNVAAQDVLALKHAQLLVHGEHAQE